MFLTKPSWDDKWCLEKNEPNNRKKKKMNENYAQLEDKFT